MAQQGSEDSNLPLSTLAGLALVAATVGIIMVFAGPAVYGVVLLGFAFQTWILLLVFWAWRNERRTVPAAAYKTLTAEDIAAAIKQALPAAGGQPATPAGPTMNRVQREAAAGRTATWSEEQPAALTIPPVPVMNRMQQEAAARAAAAKAGQALPMGWSEEQK